MKESAEKRANDLKLENLEMKGKVDQLLHKVATLTEDISHVQHLKKIELAELKQFYLNKMEATAIEVNNSRERAVLECECQIRLKNEQIKGLEISLEQQQALLQQK